MFYQGGRVPHCISASKSAPALLVVNLPSLGLLLTMSIVP